MRRSSSPINKAYARNRSQHKETPALEYRQYCGARLERRSLKRYPLQLRLTGRVLNKGSYEFSGESINLSVQGILFSTNHLIPVGSLVHLDVDWPALSGNGLPQTLCLSATVIRAEGRLVAGRIWSHDLNSPPADRVRLNAGARYDGS